MNTKLLSMAATTAGALGALVLGMAAPSVANATAVVSQNNCSVSDIIPTAGACSGYYAGNQLGLGGNMSDTQAAALAALGFVGTVTQIEHIDLNNSPTIDFDTLLNGVTFIGVHWGNGKGGPGNVTGFYRLDLADNAQLDTIMTRFATTNSGAVLFKTSPCEGLGCTPGGGVPEPATWAMMIIGFGGIGALMRRRRMELTVA